MHDPIEIIRTQAGSSRSIRVERNRPSDPRTCGYIIDCSDSLCMVHQFNDFQPDGYAILRLEDVVSVRSGEHERHWDRMLAGEDLLRGLDDPPGIDLGSIHRALASADRLFGRVIIECEDAEEPIEDFYIGKVACLDDTGVVFHNFDGLGRWDPSPHTIRYDEITRLQLGTPYTNRFWKYLDGEPPK